MSYVRGVQSQYEASGPYQVNYGMSQMALRQLLLIDYARLVFRFQGNPRPREMQ